MGPVAGYAGQPRHQQTVPPSSHPRSLDRRRADIQADDVGVVKHQFSDQCWTLKTAATSLIPTVLSRES